MDPLMLDVPESFESERLLLRAPLPGDGTFWYAALLASADDVAPWLSWPTEITSLEAAERRLRNQRIEWLQRVAFHALAFERVTGVFVGGISIAHIDWRVPKRELGYWTASKHQGKGFATEGAQAAATWARDVLGMRRVQIRCEPANTRSRRVAERAGFVEEARLKNDVPALHGDVRDAIVYAMTR